MHGLFRSELFPEKQRFKFTLSLASRGDHVHGNLILWVTFVSCYTRFEVYGSQDYARVVKCIYSEYALLNMTTNPLPLSSVWEIPPFKRIYFSPNREKIRYGGAILSILPTFSRVLDEYCQWRMGF